MQSTLAFFNLYNMSLDQLSNKKNLLINTINAHSFNISQNDSEFKMALNKSDVLLPDGISIVFAMRFLKGLRLQKIAGADLFYYEMDRLNKMGGNCFFLGSSNETLEKIKKRVSKDYSDVKVYYHSPPYKSEFDEVDNKIMIEKINAVEPDVLFIGMTAPKQEKWAYSHFNKLKAGHVCSVGAVFDFYAGTVNRSPNFMIYIGLEWLYRLIKEPRRMWRRYLLGNTKFIGYILKEKFVSFK